MHMRSLIPLAAYFEPAAFDRPIRGVYIVTPSVDGDPRAMREHNWASIVNTSVHEAYPGHHQQFSAALTSPTPARLLTDAPEFHEGWGMYCEQMMLEAGFEDTPARRVIVATDAIWRACRIVLDIGLHRGEIGVEEAIDFLVEHTRFERPVARAEVHRYTQTPGYNLSYLLGKVLLLRLRADEQERLGPDFSLKRFHDALLYSGSLPVSFHRRLLAGEGGGPTLRRGPRAAPDAGHPQPRPPEGPLAAGLVAGCLHGRGRPTDRPAAIAEALVAQGAPAIHLVDLDGAQQGRPVNLEAIGGVARAVAKPLQVAGGVDGPEQVEMAFAAGATRVVLPLWAVAEDRARLASCLGIAGDWLAVGLDARPGEPERLPLATSVRRRDSESWCSSWARPACAASSSRTCPPRVPRS